MKPSWCLESRQVFSAHVKREYTAQTRTQQRSGGLGGHVESQGLRFGENQQLRDNEADPVDLTLTLLTNAESVQQ